MAKEVGFEVKGHGERKQEKVKEAQQKPSSARGTRRHHRGLSRRVTLRAGKRDQSHLVLDAADDDAALNFTELMGSWPLFTNSVPGLVEALAMGLHSRTVNPGQQIALRGSASSSLVFVIAGIVDVSIDNELVASLASGSYIGETNLLGVDTHWSVTLTAHGFCTIGEITRDHIALISEKSSEAARWFASFQKLKQNVNDEGDVLMQSFRPFECLPKAVAIAIEATMTNRVFFPGERMITENESGDELFIIVRGRAILRRSNQVLAEIDPDTGHDPIILGELGLFGFEPVRTATVTIESATLVRVLYRSVFLKHLDEQGEFLRAGDVEAFVRLRYNDKAYIPPGLCFEEGNIFQRAECGKDFLDFLAKHIQKRVYIMGQKVVDEHADDRSLYTIASGAVHIVRKGHILETLRKPSTFGEKFFLGCDEERIGDVVAAETSVVEVLGEEALHEAVSLYPHERPHVFAAVYMTVGGADEVSADKTASNQDSIIKDIMRAPFFSRMDEQLVVKLAGLSDDRIFLPGESVIEEGQKGDSMFILVSGQATVYQQQHQTSAKHGKKDCVAKISTLAAGSIFGELAMLGIKPCRGATVVAGTMCSLWETKQEPVMDFLSEHPECRTEFFTIIKNNLEHTVTSRFDTFPMFHNFDSHFRIHLGINASRRVYFPGDTMVDETELPEGLVIINLGKAALQKSSMSLLTFSVGQYVGATNMLGVGKRLPGILVALEVCHVLVVTRECYEQALKAYPAPEVARALLKTETETAARMYKDFRRRDYLLRSIASGMAFDSQVRRRSSIVVVPPIENLASAFQAWYHMSKEHSVARKQKQRRRKDLNEWVMKAQAARDYRALKETLGAEDQQPFSWMRRPEWDNSDSKKSRFPLVSPTIWLAPQRLDCAVREPVGASTPRHALPPIGAVAKT